MMARIIRRLWLLTIWTIFIWTNRLLNLAGDTDVGSSEKGWVIAIAAIFLLLSLISLIFLAGLWKHRSTLAARFAGIFGLGTAVFWVVRGAGILFANQHDFSFKFVHSILALVSVLLGAFLYFAGDNRKTRFRNWGDRPAVR